MIQFRSFLPFLKWPSLSASLLRSESLAGLTVGLMVIPQSVAYAALANTVSTKAIGSHAALSFWNSPTLPPLKASTTAPFIKDSKAFATNAVALDWWPFRACDWSEEELARSACYGHWRLNASTLCALTIQKCRAVLCLGSICQWRPTCWY